MRRPRERPTFGAMPTQAAFADRLADASKAIAYLAASKPSADTSALRDHRAQLERVASRQRSGELPLAKARLAARAVARELLNALDARMADALAEDRRTSGAWCEAAGELLLSLSEECVWPALASARRQLRRALSTRSDARVTNAVRPLIMRHEVAQERGHDVVAPALEIRDALKEALG